MSKSSEKDDFWDLSRLVPKKAPIRPFANGVKTVEHKIHTPSDSKREENSDRKLSFSQMTANTEKQPDVSYEPKRGGFIKRVTIKRTLDRFDFYGNFRKAALVYFDYKTQKCDFAPFYSYTPQYSQLSIEQKNYYFYWRDEVRRGNYIRTNYSYITLYAYEILNLPDLIPPEEGVKMLALVWKSYRRDLPRLDSSFSVWVQDYCLVHNLECPTDIIGDFIHEIIEFSGFPEFYLSCADSSSADGVGVIVSYLSDYDWRRAKYAASDEDGFYKKNMLRAMSRLISAIRADGSFFGVSDESAHVFRTAFPKSLVTHSVKCTLEIEYCPIVASPTVRETITNAVRYTENKLRCAMGVKSRLSVKNLDSYHKYIIDKYFDSVFEKENAKRKIENVPEYEKLYDAPRVDISVAGADEIEKSSWLTTKRLVVEEKIEPEITEPPEIVPILCKEPQAGSAVKAEQRRTDALPREREFLCEVMSGNAAWSAENDILAERINELSLDVIGDVIIEILGDGYTFVEDYREDAERLFEEK